MKPRGGFAPTIHLPDFSLEAPVRDIPADQWIPAAVEPLSRLEVAAIAAIVSLLVVVLVGLASLVALAILAWRGI